MMKYSKSVAYLLIISSSFISAQNSPEPLKNFCRRFEHSTAILNNKLYVDGGYINSSPQSANETNPDLLYGDLLTKNEGFPQFYKTPSKPAPLLAGNTLWPDEINHRLYAFGGYFPSFPKPFQTWTYDTLLSVWTSVPTLNSPTTYLAHGMSAVAPEAGIAYYWGGWRDGKTDSAWRGKRRYESGMVSFDMVRRRYGKVEGPPDGYGRAEGWMGFLGISEMGYLVGFGGVWEGEDGEIRGASMADIYLFDVELQKWFYQPATGDIPSPRIRFCGGIGIAPDKSSYNIYVVGGIDPEMHTNGFGEVYVLSLPAFVWVRMWPAVGYNVSEYFPVHSMSCNVVNGSQMVILGGFRPNKTADCDAPNVYGQHGLDMGQTNEANSSWWELSYDGKPYQVPRFVYEVIGGDASGKANYTSPMNATAKYNPWIFTKPYRVPTRTPTPIPTVSGAPVSSHSAPPPISTSSSPTRGVLIGAIVGSIIGGVVLGVAGFYALSFLRRRMEGKERSVEELGREKEGEKGRRVDEKRVSELVTEEKPREIWVEPVELEGRGVEGGEGLGRIDEGVDSGESGGKGT
ncbi:hypothetical protein B0J11DRAFT_66918 [Dendryphion nanum]|uniref:Kelch repeat-containing protein n=1 Tax=Dendryphion nanum TaxID=256645 RepID=A0A9P9DI99_9PLEO|nr:hypothetical protein B0J11DRAFT_66918 [Dendryphion nanum]